MSASAGNARTPDHRPVSPRQAAPPPRAVRPTDRTVRPPARSFSRVTPRRGLQRMPATPGRRVGLWMIGAYGGVATTIAVGLTAMARGLRERTALVSELPLFTKLGCPEPADFVIGGHEIRDGSFEQSAEEFRRSSGVLDADLMAACRETLAEASSRVRPGTIRARVRPSRPSPTGHPGRKVWAPRPSSTAWPPRSTPSRRANGSIT